MNRRFNEIIIILLLFIFLPHVVGGQTAGEIQSQIKKHESQINILDKEIARYEDQLNEIGQEKQTLEGAVRELDISRRKISANAAVARNKISAAELEITEINREIEQQEKGINVGAQALAETIRRLNEAESETLVETILQHEKLSHIWENIESVQQFQARMQERMKELAQTKRTLEEAKEELQEKKIILIYERDNLSAQQRALDINRREKNALLSQTKEQESNYQKLLEEKRAARHAFEAALLDLESQLEYTLDPSKIPPAGKGVLRWPLDAVTITQFFGNTKFAQSGAYSGRGHNGVDFRASIGTPVRAALSGKIEALGNTDQHPGCYSYGKWVLVRHNNGLSTLYAHLSDFAVFKGETVGMGNVIGYSGNTGYSTGPHLHFGTYQSDAVQIVRLGDVKKRTNCANAHIPVAPLKAYLNPLDYLPD